MMVLPQQNVDKMNPTSIDYYNQIQALYNSDEFKNGYDPKKRELIGNLIYDFIESIAGQDKAPKLCGMVIDLP